MATVRWTVGARADLRDIVMYISQDSAVYAAAWAGRIVATVERLRQFPSRGRIVPEYQEPTLRELIVGNYRVVYRIQRRRVGIIAIVHASRDLLRQLPSAPWDFN
ncbi:MAG: type II toxin-antitoxin system RelE/ParE family toxin [Nitrospiraceae bacterium]